MLATELSLGEPDVDEGLVTWFDVRVVAGERAESLVIGNARVAGIHVGEASNLGEPLYHVLDADSGELSNFPTGIAFASQLSRAGQAQPSAQRAPPHANWTASAATASSRKLRAPPMPRSCARRCAARAPMK